ncbi:MAG: NAD(P)/FAD-dependent oxidoreductase [Candidatus Helarchaeota archaeon]|nr:NAD(P)/FAD-dependent oxidoreductase [Candidatus Helarchaeota archaeon]
MEFDLIIAGADCAGSTVAKLVGEAGYSVLLIDEKDEGELGRPWHDAVFPFVFELTGIKPFGKERTAASTKIFSPNQKISGVVVGGKDYLVSREELSAKLIGSIKNIDNIVFKDKTEVIRPLQKDNSVVGVELKEMGAVKQYKSNITVDATGFKSVLRKQMPFESGIDSSDVDDYETCVTTKQIRKRKEGDIVGESVWGVYGGGMWVNNDRPGISEVGLRYRGTLDLNINEILGEFSKSREYIDDKIITARTELVPVRRSYDQLVSNGFMLVGVSGCQSDAMSGMGVSASVLAGSLAAKTIINAIKEKKYDMRTLWPYQVEYIREKGAEYSGLDIMKKYFQYITEDEFNFLFEKEIITFEIIEYLGGKKETTAEISFRQLFLKFMKGMLYKPGLMNRLRKAISQGEKMRKIYAKFPEKYDKELFEKWKFNVNKLINKVKKECSKFDDGIEYNH